MTRWEDAIGIVYDVPDAGTREALMALYRLIKFVYDSIPEIENGG